MPAPSPTSLVDVVDDADHPIGVAPRRTLLARALGFRTAHVLLFDESDRLLLQQLAASRERHPLLWGSSVAGYLHSGEDYEAAAARRLVEELDLTAPLTAIGVMPMQDGASQKFVGIFTGRTAQGRPRIVDAEHVAALQWCGAPEVLTTLATDPARYTATFRAVFSYAMAAGVLPRS